MCGRFSLLETPEEVAAYLALMELEAFPPRYNIAPTQPILMVIAGETPPPGSNRPDRRALLVRWGFIPGWVKDTANYPLMINARSETAIEKASFKAAMRHRRALVPASGFYEWRRDGNRKSQAYWVRPRNGATIAFAGIYEPWANAEGSEMDTGAILTTSASEDLRFIHDRMPVVIEQKDFARWLDCKTQEPRHVADLLRPAQADFFEAIRVSNRVNKVDNTGPEIQERFVETLAEAKKPGSVKPPEPDNQMKLF
ncbi:SOS response-associated peptidase [Phyllobacterium zundukense]|jgi:putative SOS response-associated peptidase YedK|uniref:SOS response-associated peptidase n=1 Tax=Phyllobacterium zundukense TaxID=1867719 RepID=A0ACD4D458_9HYPH|nr:SOS response-associated peptidase [Phyllobacterium zundukense]UXN60645.1 SOS response-associated peptidase [Phyllobacterium zundukense]